MFECIMIVCVMLSCQLFIVSYLEINYLASSNNDDNQSVVDYQKILNQIVGLHRLLMEHFCVDILITVHFIAYSANATKNTCFTDDKLMRKQIYK